jgi:hypothetical protein
MLFFTCLAFTLLFPLLLFGMTIVHYVAMIAALMVASIALFIVRPVSVDDVSRREKGMLLVRYTGQDPPLRIRAGFAVHAASATMSLIVGITMLLDPAGYISLSGFKLDYFMPTGTPLPTFKLALREIGLVYAGAILVFTVIAVFGLLNMRREIQVTETRWATPKQYDCLEAALHGRVVLGPDHEHTIMSTAFTHQEREEERLKGQTKGRNVEKLIHHDEPFFLELERYTNPHFLGCGESGQGKTRMGEAICVRYWNAKHIPSLILDYKGDYSTRDPDHADEPSFMEKLGGLVLDVPSAFTINPLKLEGLSPLHRAQVAAELLITSIELSPLQAGELVEIILEAYKQRGILEENTQTENEKNESKTQATVLDVMDILDTKRKEGAFKGEKLNSVNWTIEKIRLVKHIFKSEDINFFDLALKIPAAINLSPLKGIDVAKTLVINAILKRVQERSEARHLSGLRMLVIVDEAHRIFKTQLESKGLIKTEPLIVQILRESRKYGFAQILLTQLASDVQEEAAANVATIASLGFDESNQVRHVRQWINMTKPELESFRRLPKGGAFIKTFGDPHPHLIRVQLVDDREFAYSRKLCRATIAKDLMLQDAVKKLYREIRCKSASSNLGAAKSAKNSKPKAKHIEASRVSRTLDLVDSFLNVERKLPTAARGDFLGYPSFVYTLSPLCSLLSVLSLLSYSSFLHVVPAFSNSLSPLRFLLLDPCLLWRDC